MKRIGGFKEVEIDKILASTEILNYRNKTQIPFGKNKNGDIVSGFYGLHSHNIMECIECKLQPEIFDKIIFEIKKWMTKYKITPYDEKTTKGCVRHAYIRCSGDLSQIMVCIVVNGKTVPYKSELIELLTSKFKSIKGIIVNFNSEDTNVILGNKFSTIWGESYITDNLCGLKFKISPESFYQINHDQTQKLYDLSKKILKLSGNENILDLYCGIGTIGLTMADKVKKLTGIEIVNAAILNAYENARLNDIKNANFICSDSARVVGNFLNTSVDVIILDPPRKGCEESVLEDIIKIFPEKILYISCNPATLARDLKKLCCEKYEILKVCPVDLFPRTPHVETCVLLGRKMVNDKNIEYEYVDYEPEDAEYLRGTKGSATYAEIKAWIKKQYNVSVSTLYIAQCKDSCGFEKRENYHIGAEGHRVPKCTEEKRKMILEAFKHFRMM